MAVREVLTVEDVVSTGEGIIADFVCERKIEPQEEKIAGDKFEGSQLRSFQYYA